MQGLDAFRTVVRHPDQEVEHAIRLKPSLPLGREIGSTDRGR